jgi:DNA helicase-2/ATP-dependent DNA helicase PcrA
MNLTPLTSLNDPQREAVLHTEGPLLVLAGAGSGKTRVITLRIAHLLEKGVAPWHILAVTFTNKASEEMKNRVNQLAPGLGSAVVMSTYHRFCSQLLRREGEAIGLSKNYVIYDEHDQKDLIKECLTELNLDEKKFKPGVLLGLISRSKDELIDAQSYQIHALANDDPFRHMVASVYHLYQKKLTASNAVDFGDLIMKSVEVLRDHSAIREKYQERFRYVMVDEYQDTNRAQYVLTKTLAAKHRNLCVVGDDDQCVYVWRGADIRNILEFEKEYPEAKVVKLEQNYRSTERILDCAWKVVHNNKFRKDKKLWTAQLGGEPVTSDEFSDERQEALVVASTIRQGVAAGDMNYKDYAVFYRINAQSRVLEDALRRMEVPYKIVGSVRFYDRAEVKDVLAYLRLIVNPKDTLALRRIVNVPTRGLGKTSLEQIERFAGERLITLFEALGLAREIPTLTGRAQNAAVEFHTLISTLITNRDVWSSIEMIRQVLDATGILKLLEAEEDGESLVRAQNIRELVNAVSEYEERSPTDKSTAGFLEQVSLVADSDEIDLGPNYVTLMTVHLAKGLEFPFVFMTGMEEGLFPIGESDFSQEELEEERRLCYVGMTRAKKWLYLTWASSRKLFGHSRWNAPSRFIQEAGLTTSAPKISSPVSSTGPAPAGSEVREPVFDHSHDFDHMEEVTGVPMLTVGMRVRHAEFGNGKIIEKSGIGDALKVVVLFDSGQWKKLLVKYANLERI